MTKRRNVHKLVAGLVGLTLVAAACGSADSDPLADSPPGTGTPTPSAPTAPSTSTTSVAVTTVPTSTGGWIDGEPDWSGADGERLELAYEAPAFADAEVGASSSEIEVDRDATLMPVEPDGGIGEGAPPPGDAPFREPDIEPDIEKPVDVSPLRAGSVDDNVDYQGFLDYLERIDSLGIVLRDLDSTGRTVVTVTGSNGLPVSGAEVTATVGDVAVSLRTTADGTVRFLPWYLHGDQQAGDQQAGDQQAGDQETGDPEVVQFSSGEVTASAAPGESVELVIDRPGGADVPVPLDILFLLDATGSMGDEIDRLKQTIDMVAARVADLEPAPDVRFAMTLYRDERDAFVTANYDFTGDVGEFQAALADVVADGGGDYPEALDEGLADALAKPAWRDPADAVQLIFVVADAPPQVRRQVQTPYPESIREAVGRGIKIFPVASSESDDQAEAVFRQLAQATGAPFVFLSNGAGGASLGGGTDIQSTDYEELALDELVVRLIAEELADLTDGGLNGGGVTVPTTIAPATTNPDGQ